MKCESCNQPLTVSNFKMTDNNTKGKQTLVCTNKDCNLYCGTNLNNPKIIARTVIIDL